LQPFTGDRLVAKKAVMRTRAGGAAALFDSILHVSKDLEERKGKRTLVVFTDGKDNSSTMSVTLPGSGRGGPGIPIYTVAQGEALVRKQLTEQLETLSSATGGASFAVRRTNEVERVFEQIARDLQSTYMIAYQPPPSAGTQWREIRVSVPDMKKATVRARTGYLPRGN
jgi:VWFA-related protein